VLTALLTLGIAYVAALGVARLGYRSILYPAPAGDDTLVKDLGALETFAAADGVPVHALVIEPPPGARMMVLFHGNAEVIGYHFEVATALASQGLGVALVEYRGYGVSRGAPPTEQGLYLDAEAVLAGLAQRGIGPERVVLWGTSLGTGIAAEMARRGRCAALVLVSPYTSIPDVAAIVSPRILPARLIIGDRYDTLAKAAEIHVPTLVIHGEDDELIPFRMGRAVASAIPGASLLAVPRGHHDDLYVYGGPILARIVLHATQPAPVPVRTNG
jgi:hypothetical protein